MSLIANRGTQGGQIFWLEGMHAYVVWYGLLYAGRNYFVIDKMNVSYVQVGL